MPMIDALTCGDSLGQRAAIRAKSAASGALSAPDSAPPVDETAVFPDDWPACSSPSPTADEKVEGRGSKNSKQEFPMLSARNQFKGTVKEVKLGNVMAEVVVSVGGVEIVSAITRSSAEKLALKPGDTVTAIIKSTEVMIDK